MSMKVQGTFSNCCEGIKNFAISAGSWIGRSVTAFGSFLAESAKKIADYVKPHFETLKAFAVEHKQHIFIAAIGLAVGAIATRLFCRGTSSSAVASTTAETAPKSEPTTTTTTTTATA